MITLFKLSERITYMNIGIFGGAFNPPHKMHKEIAIELLEKNYVDKIIYVPTGNNYNKPGLLDGKHRINMLNLMIDDYKEKISVSDFEEKGNLHTLNTLNYFKEKYPKDEIFFICGTDNLNDFEKWYHYEDILANYKLLIVAREKNNFDDIITKYEKYKDRIILSDVVMEKTSSTSIRKEILENGFSANLSDVLDEKVIHYLENINIDDAWSKSKL